MLNKIFNLKVKKEFDMTNWKEDTIKLIKDTERFIAETEIAAYIYEKLELNRSFTDVDPYNYGFEEALEGILEFINERKHLRLGNE